MEEDTQRPEQVEYASEYRGRVQDKQTDLVPEPLYVLTYYKRMEGVSSFIPFHQTVDNFNRAGQLPCPLFISNAEVNATEEQTARHFQSIHTITEQLADSAEMDALYLRRAMDYYHVRDFDACLSDLDRVIQLQSYGAIPYFLRAQVRCAQMSVDKLTSEQVDKSLGEARINSSTEAKIAYGLALDDLQQVMALAPDMVFAQYNIGNVYVQLHEYDLACQAYTRALEIDPRFPDAYYNRGIVRLLDGHTDDGLSDLSQAGEYGLYGAYNLIKRYSKTK